MQGTSMFVIQGVRSIPAVDLSGHGLSRSLFLSLSLSSFFSFTQLFSCYILLDCTVYTQVAYMYCCTENKLLWIYFWSLVTSLAKIILRSVRCKDKCPKWNKLLSLSLSLHFVPIHMPSLSSFLLNMLAKSVWNKNEDALHIVHSMTVLFQLLTFFFFQREREKIPSLLFLDSMISKLDFFYFLSSFQVDFDQSTMYNFLNVFHFTSSTCHMGWHVSRVIGNRLDTSPPHHTHEQGRRRRRRIRRRRRWAVFNFTSSKSLELYVSSLCHLMK